MKGSSLESQDTTDSAASARSEKSKTPFVYPDKRRASDSDSSDSGQVARRAEPKSSLVSLEDPRLNKFTKVVQVANKRNSSGSEEDYDQQRKCGRMEPVNKPKLLTNPFVAPRGTPKPVADGLFIPKRTPSTDSREGFSAPPLVRRDSGPGPAPTTPMTPTTPHHMFPKTPVPVSSPVSRSEIPGRPGETIDWFRCQPIDSVDVSNVLDWKACGTKKATSEHIHCDEDVLKDLVDIKTKYLKLNMKVATSARSRCNPYESVSKGIFLNRAAVKLANIDADVNFWLTSPPPPRYPDGTPMHLGNQLMHFADICAGPGGFTEYILYRKRFESKGYGITKREDSTNMELTNIQAGPAECYEIYYGKHNDGDIYAPANVKSFVDFVDRSTENQGVQLVLADGGFDVKGRELEQEKLYKQMYLSEFLIAVQILREHGTFVCKLFDTYTDFSIDLLYILHLFFEEITMYKPRMSRAQNTEKYMICRGRRGRNSSLDHLIRLMTECHELLWSYNQGPKENLREFDIIRMVNPKVYKTSAGQTFAEAFIQKMKHWNTSIARIQIRGIADALEFAKDPLRQHVDHEAFMRKCYSEWHLPVDERGEPLDRNHVLHANEMTCETYDRVWKESISPDQLEERILTATSLSKVFASPYDWRVVVVQGKGTTYRETRGFYMSKGGRNVLYFNAKTCEWEQIESANFKLPRDTILYGEWVMEFTRFARTKAFHIIDALVIDGRDLSKLHYIARHEFCYKLASAVNKSSRMGLDIVRVKQLVRMEHLADLLDRCEQQTLHEDSKTHWSCPIDHTDENAPVLSAAGLMFLKITADPWTMALSRKNNRKYVFNRETGVSSYEIPPEAAASFLNTMQERTLWRWDLTTDLSVPVEFEEAGAAALIDPPVDPRNPEAVHAAHILRHLSSFRSQCH